MADVETSVTGAPDTSGGNSAGTVQSDAASENAGSSTASSSSTSTYDSDPAIRKYIEDKVSSQLRHIPNEYRTPDRFRSLQESAGQFDRLRQDPNYLAYLAARQGGGQNQVQQKALRDEVLGALTTKYGKLADRDSGILGDLVSEVEKAFTSRIVPGLLKQHVGPLYQQFWGDKVNAERETAAKLPGWKEHEDDIKKIVHESEGHISFEQAYKIATHGKQFQKAAEEEEAAATAGDKKKAASEKPGGMSAGGLKTKKPTTKQEAREAARRELRAQGLLT